MSTKSYLNTLAVHQRLAAVTGVPADNIDTAKMIEDLDLAAVLADVATTHEATAGAPRLASSRTGTTPRQRCMQG